MSTIVKVVYFLLFLGLVVLPHFIVRDILFLPQAYAQSLGSLVLVCIGLLLYYLHEWDLRRMEKKLEVSTDKLNNAYTYLGTVNRRLPLLKNVTTDLLRKSDPEKNKKKEVFESLLATVVTSLIHADWGMFRFIDVGNTNTVREYIYTHKNYVLLKTEIGNQDMLDMRGSTGHVHELQDLYVLHTSDATTSLPCFLIFPKGGNNIDDVLPVIQSIVDQAQLFYKYYYPTAEH
ncbi:hypothetical protein A3I42_03700 [Candidatus Uhrbacteria bacterium RIFCSPLOWO2_02_FULL_49_11]|uniref:Uncharacterized protein n=1 Tax=Candidatus Uhrbacteria bacterium RIFCSPLOWO2_02_FULL_49_11 TaxID=1802409 RepID=A0A1F7VC65_9BACT|nr:MAG: hypothetical protein A3I42_03700 [Candidatus Uhrbacteria bacterium RIFCSPLOWO2_02_FULL_49_11]